MCDLCRGVGWVIDCNPTRSPLNVEIIKCPIPDCTDSGKKIEIISVNELDFHRVTYHPETGMIMAIRK